MCVSILNEKEKKKIFHQLIHTYLRRKMMMLFGMEFLFVLKNKTFNVFFSWIAAIYGSNECVNFSFLSYTKNSHHHYDSHSLYIVLAILNSNVLIVLLIQF